MKILWIILFLICTVVAFIVWRYYNNYNISKPIIIASVMFIIIALLGICIILMYKKHKLQSTVSELALRHSNIIDEYKANISQNKSDSISDKIGMPIYYINLDRSPDRKEFIEKQFKMYGLTGTRISGIDGANIKSVFALSDTKQVPFINKSANNSGELGCTLSHIKAIYTAYMNGDELALIIEDDSSFALAPHWPCNFKTIMSEAPKGWSIIALFGFHPIKGHIYSPFSIEKPFFSTSAYIINRQGMYSVLSEILTTNKLTLIPISSPKSIQSDVLIYALAGPSYCYTDIPIIIPYNDHILMDSTIHNDATHGHIKIALERLNSCFVGNGSSSHIRQHWTSNKPIPKIIHNIWYKWKADKPSDLMQKMSKHCKEVYPGYTFKMWDEVSGRDLIVKDFPWFLKTYDAYDVTIKRIDSIRYFILLKEGGIYMDMDTICISNLEPLLKDGQAVFGYQLENKDSAGSINIGVMASPPGHPLFENIIYALPGTVNKKVVAATGPEFVTEIIKKYSGNDVTVVPMPGIYTHEWNDDQNNSLAESCIDNPKICESMFPDSYTTTTFARSWW